MLTRLRAGDELAFRALVKRHDAAMRRLALSFVQTTSVADEVVQETWLAVIRGLKGFEGRSSLKTRFHDLWHDGETVYFAPLMVSCWGRRSLVHRECPEPVRGGRDQR
jgi:hypothetical protein